MEDAKTKELANNLKRAMSHLLKILRREMKKDADFSLTELSTLGSIYKQSKVIPSELAAQEKVTTQSMSQILKQLSNKGYITKTRSEKDKRKMLIAMTPEGNEFVKCRMHHKRAWLANAIKEKTTEKERQTLKKMVSILTKLADHPRDR